MTKSWITRCKQKCFVHKDLLHSTGNSPQHGGLDGRGVWERMDTCVCMAGTLHCWPETVTILFVNQPYPSTK